jgi:hypothetical protein
MKIIVTLLLLLNVGLLLYFNIEALAPKPVMVNRSIQADKLKILSASDVAAMPKKVVEVAAKPALMLDSATGCYQWGSFTQTNLPAAQAVLAGLGVQGVVKQVPTGNEDRRFWVYYPPLKTAALAQQKVDEIKALGVQDLFIVQDLQWRNAISFGLFQDEQLASTLLDELLKKGVKGATKSLRSPGKLLSSLVIKNMAASTALALQKIKPEFVGTELTPAACP